RGEDARPAARPFVERGELVFLVRRMDAVVVEAETDHQRIHSQIALENADDRDRAAGANEHRLVVPFRLPRAARTTQRLGAERQGKRAACAMRDELRAAICGQTRADERTEIVADALGILLA